MAALPTARWRRHRVEIERVDYLSPTTGGRIGAVSAGWPLWRLDAEPWFRTETEAEAFTAWIDSLNGPQVPFLAGPERTLPLAHARGLPGGWNGDAGGWSVNAARTGLTLTGLNAGAVLRPGDRIGFRWATEGAARATMVKVVAGGAGATQALTVTPAVPMIVPGNAVAHVRAPQALFRLTPETEVGGMDGGRTRFVSVRAIQDLLP